MSDVNFSSVLNEAEKGAAFIFIGTIAGILLANHLHIKVWMGGVGGAILFYGSYKLLNKIKKT